MSGPPEGANSDRARPGVLYVSYDGMLEPLGQSQVLGYLEHLTRGRRVHLLSFEKPSDWNDAARRERIARRILSAGITWHPLTYHKRPPVVSTFLDLATGTVAAIWLVLRHRLKVVHARSDVPAFMAWIAKRLAGSKLLFDMRGFWADERVDGGLWKAGGALFRISKWLERRFIARSDHLVVLTNAGERALRVLHEPDVVLPPISVIPTCADLQRFHPMASRPERLVVGYVGAAGTWYLFDDTVRAFSRLLALRPDAHILIINRNEHDYIRSRLEAGGIPADSFELRAAEHAEMPGQMARMSACIFFIRPAYSKLASAPTKLGELLGCGVPCLSNTGVGDMAEIIEGEAVGIAIPSFDDGAIESGLRRLLSLLADSHLSERCVATARKHFSLESGLAAYESVYRRLGL